MKKHLAGPPAPNMRAGNEAEALASQYLLEKGYQLLKRNYRPKGSKCEIDIIAEYPPLKNTVIFIEVKSLARDTAGYPEEQVTKKKETFLAEAADLFLHEESRGAYNVRFDIVSVGRAGTSSPEIYHIEDAFFPGLF